MEGITREKGDTLYFSPCIKCGNIKEECPPFPPFGQLFEKGGKYWIFII